MRCALVAATCLILCAAAAPADTPSPSLKPLVNVLLTTDDAAVQRDVLQGMIDALQGRRLSPPEGWARVKEKLGGSANAEVREKTLLLSVMFGDPDATAAMRQTAAELNTGPLPARPRALTRMHDRAVAQAAGADGVRQGVARKERSVLALSSGRTALRVALTSPWTPSSKTVRRPSRVASWSTWMVRACGRNVS